MKFLVELQVVAEKLNSNFKDALEISPLKGNSSSMLQVASQTVPFVLSPATTSQTNTTLLAMVMKLKLPESNLHLSPEQSVGRTVLGLILYPMSWFCNTSRMVIRFGVTTI